MAQTVQRELRFEDTGHYTVIVDNADFSRKRINKWTLESSKK
jgi:hypothetical protein